MTRKRLRMELIPHEPTRLATFKKRKVSILKKASELSALCAVPVCVVISNGNNDSSPEIWPESEAATGIISRFNALSETEQTKKMVDKSGFVSQQIEKMKMQLARINRENQELQDKLLLRDLLAGNRSIVDLQDREVVMRLQRINERQIGEIRKRKEELLSVSVCAPVPVPVQTGPESDVTCGTGSMKAIVPVSENNFSLFIDGSDMACSTGSMASTVPVSENYCNFSPLMDGSDVACSTSSMTSIVPGFEDNFNFSPLMGGFGEKEEFFDAASLPLWWFEGNEEPHLPEKDSGFELSSADVSSLSESVSQNGKKYQFFSESVSQNEEKDQFFSESDQFFSELGGDVLAVPDWSETDEEMTRLFDQFEDYQEMAELLSSF